MTNKPMLSVERELLDRIARPLKNMADEPARRRAIKELRALLDKPVLESQYEGMTQDQAQAVSDGVDEILHGEPAAHKQPAPVYQVCDGVNGWIDVDLLRYTACCLDPEEYECRVLYAEQPAPLRIGSGVTVKNVGFGPEQDRKPYLFFDSNANLIEVNLIDVSLVSMRKSHTVADLEEMGVQVEVVMPDRNKIMLRQTLEIPWGYTLGGSMKYELQIWQAALDEVARLNGVKL